MTCTLALPVSMRTEVGAFSKITVELGCRTPKSIFLGAVFRPDTKASGSAAIKIKEELFGW